MMASCLTLHSSLLTLQSKTLTGKQSSPQKTYLASKENIDVSAKSRYVKHPSPEKLFDHKEIVLELSAQISARDKRELKNKITENGGKVSFVVSKRTELMVCESEHLTTRKFNLALQYGVPIVTLNYLHDCLKQRKLLPFDKYLVTNRITSNAFDSGKVKLLASKSVTRKQNRIAAVATPYVPCSSLENYQLLKAVQLTNLTSLKPQKHGKKDAVTIRFYVIELHGQTNRTEDDSTKYCVFTHEGILCNGSFEKDNTTRLCRFLETVDDAVAVYAQLDDQMSGLPHLMKPNDSLIHPDVGSPAFQSMQLERFEMLSSLDPAVSQLVGALWMEAVGHISEFLAEKPSGIRPWTVVEAEGILLQVLSVLGKCSDELLHKLSKEFYTILPHLPQHEVPLLEKRIVVQKLDLCQVLKDMIAVSEATGWAPRGDPDAKYRALHCRLQFVLESNIKFEKISSLVIGSQKQPNGVSVKRIFQVQRSIEHAVFTQEIHYQQMLFHCTMPSNVVGILSHGLLPPRLAVTKRGVERTDAGMLGSGIYFTDSISHAIKYSKPSKSGTRFLLVSMVALGDVYKVYEINPDLDAPPENFNSVQGVQSTQEKPSEFPGNEFVIYSSSQQKLCYLVEFNLPEDVLQAVEEDTSYGITDYEVKKPGIIYSYDLSDFFQDKSKQSSSGLKVVPRDGSASLGSDLALEAVHVRAQLLDTVARVVLFQVYKNPFPSDVEVKFIFPLEFGAAICGFEAFIGDKHIRGEVKEKETAHKEYKQAISEGHGAYLLDEDSPDVFTVHVGNLPSNTTAIIKISYITELPVERDAVRFTLPSSVAPWQNVSGMQSNANVANAVGEFTFQASLEMASAIISLHSPSHKIRTKKTATKGVVELESSGEWGGVFILYARLEDAHAPRMWVERNHEKGSEACMLTFYPEFEVKLANDTEIVLMLDASNSMMGSAFQDAIRVCLLLLQELSSESDKRFRFNLVAFGSFFQELFPRSRPLTGNTVAQAEAFLKQISPNMGNTDLHRLLRTYNLLTSSQVNVFVVSDGHIGEEGLVSSLSAKNFQIRVFTFATSQTANKHLLRTISSRTGGALETFDPSETGVWKDKVKRQVERARQPALSNISVHWQKFKDVNDIAQAPLKITSLFSGDCLVVYGFVSNCTMATLKASLQQQEFSTIVSTSELGKTEGNLIHSLVARGIVRDWEDGPLDDDLAVHWLRKRNSRSLVVELAKEHSLVTSLTSFLAVEKRRENEIISDVPRILEQQLVLENVDVLPYMEYQDFHTLEEKTMEQEIEEDDRSDLGMGYFDDFIIDESNMAMPAFMAMSSSVKSFTTDQTSLGAGAYRHRKIMSDEDADLEMQDDEAEDITMEKYRTVKCRFRPFREIWDMEEPPCSATPQQESQMQSLPHRRSASHVPVEKVLELQPIIDRKKRDYSLETSTVDEILEGEMQQAYAPARVKYRKQMRPQSKERDRVKPLVQAAPFGPSQVQQPVRPSMSMMSSQVQQPCSLSMSMVSSQVQQDVRPSMSMMSSQIQQSARLFGAPGPVQQPVSYFGPRPVEQPSTPRPICQPVPLFASSEVKQPTLFAAQSRVQQQGSTISSAKPAVGLPLAVKHGDALFGAMPSIQSVPTPMAARMGFPMLSATNNLLDELPDAISTPMPAEPQGELFKMYDYRPASKLQLQAQLQRFSKPCGFELSEDPPQPKQSVSEPGAMSLGQLDSMGEDILQTRKDVEPGRRGRPRKTSAKRTGGAVAFAAPALLSHVPPPLPHIPPSDHRGPEMVISLAKKNLRELRFAEEMDDGPLALESSNKVGVAFQHPPKPCPSEVFVQNIISWKGGGLPICSALFAEVKRILQKRGTSLSKFSESDSSTEVEEMFDSEREIIVILLEKHGLHSLGVTISEQIVGFVLKLSRLYRFLLEVVFPEALQSEDENDFDSVIQKASKVLAEDDTWIKILLEVNETNRKYPLIYSNLELGKSWEDFLMRSFYLG